MSRDEKAGQGDPNVGDLVGVLPAGKAARPWKPMVLIILLLTVMVLAPLMDLGQKLGDLDTWIDSFGPWAPVVFILLYIMAVVAALPGTLLTVSAGVLFGTVTGVILVSIGATTGASLAFLIGRYFAREQTEQWLRDNQQFQRLERLTERHGPIMVAFVRLVPLFPFNLVNYGFGLTKISFRNYLFWSWLCMLPFTIVYVAGGDILSDLLRGERDYPLIIALLVFLSVILVLVRHIKSILDEDSDGEGGTSKRETRDGRPSLVDLVEDWVTRDLDLCIGCDRCMAACPVSKEPFTIGELNHATEKGEPLPEGILDFAFNCVQCGRCVPPCPAGARRDTMVLYLRYKARRQKPQSYTRYIQIRGPVLPLPMRLAQKLYTLKKRLTVRQHARFMSRLPTRTAPLLFYPGCYVNSTGTMELSLRLLDHVGRPYEVLGGLDTCCGIPQMLQGELDLADKCLDALHAKVMVSRPETVITGCAECLEALLRIKAKYNEGFQVLSVVEYLMEHRDRFPEVKVRGPVTLHDSCRLSRRYRRGDTTRAAITRFAEVTEMEHTGDGSMCCYHWNHDSDPANREHRRERLAEARTAAPVLAFDCLTCLERFVKVEPEPDLELMDVLELFDEALRTGRDFESEGEAAAAQTREAKQ